MSRFIPSGERILKARVLIQKAFDLPQPDPSGIDRFSYVAQVKDFMRQAVDLVKFIPYTSGMPQETKDEAKKVIEETVQAEKTLLKM